MRAIVTALADVLFGKGRALVLGLLYRRAGQALYYRQITRELQQLSGGTIQRELNALAQLGLITRSKLGKQVFYQANGNHPVFPELRALLAKTVGIFQILRDALAPLKQRISVAFVYGSMARGEEKSASDVDLMVIGATTLEDVLAACSGAEQSLDRAVNPIVYSAAEFSSRLGSGNHFLNSVMRGEKVFLIGDEDELGKLGGERLA